MGIKKVRSYFSTHKGDEKQLIDLMEYGFLELDKIKKFCYLGNSEKEINYYDILDKATFPEKGISEKEVIKKITKHHINVINVAHPLSQVNVNPPPTDVAIVTSALSAKYNENSVWDFIGQSAAISEVTAIGMISDLIGFNKHKAGGFFTFGGSSSNLYAGKIGLNKTLKDINKKGLGNEKVVFICSELAHYSTKTAAIWLGLGLDRLITIPSNDNNEMDIKKLKEKLIKLKKKKIKIACIYATTGTTDAFGVDNIEKIYKTCKELKIDTHIHADAVIGWVYLNFKNFDFKTLPNQYIANELKKTYNEIKNIKHADSIGIDFHKTGWANYITSSFVLKNNQDLKLLERDDSTTPYLFHGHGYKPGMYTLETSRPNYAQKALANILALGKQGYRDIVIHLFTIREYFRNLCEQSGILVLNRKNHFFVSDIRLYPEKVPKHYFKDELDGKIPQTEIKRINSYNKKIVKFLKKRSHTKNSSLLSLSKHYKSTKKGHDIYCIKSYPMSPFITKKDMDKVVKDLLHAQKKINL